VDTRYGKIDFFINIRKTRVLFCALQKGAFPDLLATSGDYLRVWQTGDSGTRLECLLNNVRISSFQWNFKLHFQWMILE
jgi:hypothetical protein